MTDKIQFACPHCSSTLAVALSHAGKTAKCPVCSAPVAVPEPGGTVIEGLDELDPRGAASDRSLPNADSSLDHPQWDGQNAGEGGYPFQPDPPRVTSVGRSIAGLAAAMGVGLAAMIVWLVLATMSGYELGILAWGIGGLIGLVAGIVAKNPSPVYCAMVAVIAMGAILSAKLVMAIAIVAIHFGLTAMEDFSALQVSDKYSHAYVDQALADNQFSEERKPLAIDFNAGYFESVEEDDLEAAEAEQDFAGNSASAGGPAEQSLRAFYRNVRDQVAVATEQEKATWLTNARQRHPEWIEDYSHYQAAVMELVAQPDQLDPEAAAHAQYILSLVTNQGGEFNDTYTEELTPAEYNRRDRQLNLKCVEFLRAKSPAEIETLLRQGMQKFPEFTPFPDAFTATLDKMMLEDSLDPSLHAHATRFLHTEFGPADEMAYYEAERTPEFLASDRAMRQAVNARLTTMDENARQAAISQTKARHPDWYVLEADEELLDTEELKKDLGDGTFVGSLKMVFGVYDLLWLFLGATTAYGTALRRGKKG